MPFSHLGVVLRWRPRELKATGKHVDHRRHTPFGYMGKGYATEIALRRVNVRLDGSTRFPLSALRRNETRIQRGLFQRTLKFVP